MTPMLDYEGIRSRQAALLVRFGAFVIDIVLLVVANSLCALHVFMSPKREQGVEALIALVCLGYTFLDMTPRGTPGKRFFGVVVRSTTGDYPSLGKLLVRWMLKYFPLVVVVSIVMLETAEGHMQSPKWAFLFSDDFGYQIATVFHIGLVWSAADVMAAVVARKRTLHDRMTDTVVIAE